MTDWFPRQTFGALPAEAAGRWGAREALCFEARRWTFAELSAGVDAPARGLMGLGVRPGERVALRMVNRAEWIEAAFAVMGIGAVLVPVICRGKVASFKIPRHVVLVEDFPMTGSGKIQKARLREEARRRFPSA